MDHYKQLLIPVLLIGFLIYRRIKKTIGFQKYSQGKLIFRIVLFSLVSVLLLALTVFHPISFISDIVGIALGVGLVYLAIKNTKFEQRTDGMYYRTHIWIELSVLLLILGRVAFRLFKMSQVFDKMDELQQNRDALKDISNPFTASIFFILCTYYICYFAFILKKAQALKAETANSTV